MQVSSQSWKSNIVYICLESYWALDNTMPRRLMTIINKQWLHNSDSSRMAIWSIVLLAMAALLAVHHTVHLGGFAKATQRTSGWKLSCVPVRTGFFFFFSVSLLLCLLSQIEIVSVACLREIWGFREAVSVERIPGGRVCTVWLKILLNSLAVCMLLNKD